MKKKIIPIILIIVLIQSFFITTFAATEDELKDEKSDIQQKTDEAQDKKNEVSAEINNYNTEIQSIDESISSTEAEISTLEMQIAELQNSITQKTKDLEQKQKEYDENQQLLDERLVVMYETGETSFLDILFSSNSVIDFISNYYMLSQLAECDVELLGNIETEKNEIEQTKKTLEEQKAQVDSAKVQKELKANSLKSQKSEREQKVSQLSDTQKALQAEIDDNKAKMDAISKKIDDIIKQAMENEKNNGGTNGAGSNFDGTFAWPLDYSPRRVTSRMKIRWGRWHKGIDIGTNAENGKRVIAAAAGTVIYSEYQSGTSSSPGYGNYLIIYHGNGYASLYAHMQSKAVGSGTYVKQGQTIGYSGSTGGVAPHLHFEIRKASSVGNFFGVNNWLDPLDYLPGGYTIVD